jgi:hypothetical protein
MSASEVWNRFDAARAHLLHRLQPELEHGTAIGGQNARRPPPAALVQV